jgi:hypothetical protein
MRLIVSALLVTLSIATSLALMANQSDRFVGVHEIPPFVCDRVELVPNRSAGGVGRSGGEHVAPGIATGPGSGVSICADNGRSGVRFSG